MRGRTIVGAAFAVATLFAGVAAPSSAVPEGGGPRGGDVVLGDPLDAAHAHNDYEHERPLYDALAHGFTSVEADVWLVDGELLVAHDREDVDPARTLQSLYLDPLRDLVRQNARHGGPSVYPGWDGSLQLLIDIKSDGEATYAAIHEELAEHRRIMARSVRGHVRPGPVTAVISGNRPLETMRSQRVRFAFYDGRSGDLGSGLPASVMPLVSDNWNNLFDWQGEGPMPAAERERLHDFVAEAHTAGYRVRFWATPDRPGAAREAVWTELADAGVDHVNTDDLVGLDAFLTAREAGPDAATELTVMTFNIWVGGTRVDLDQVPAAIEAAGADVVGVQESGGNLRRIADALGWDHVNEPLQIISRYPLRPGSGADHVFVETAPDHGVAMSNVHLQAYPYGPYDLRDGASTAHVLANENGIHMEQMAGRFESLGALAGSGFPVFLTGDFNVPSHLDWTATTAAATPRTFDRALEWPVSSRLDELGFRDTYREANPDPVASPGYTWTPGYPAGTVTGDEVHDRIDFVYAAGATETEESVVVGEPASASPLPGDFGAPHSDVEVSPWPSDHRAVATTFEVEAAPLPDVEEPAPATVATDRESYAPGDPIEVTFDGGPGGERDWVGVYPAGTAPGSIPSYRWLYVSGESSGTRVVDGSAQGTTWPLPPGEYDVHLLVDDGYGSIATARFTVSDG
ncbi:endonuclease/exonuclease/phosphatase family protein [Myceligenerans salitolerans]|uniref:Endonuclease/exonuclease/phosphatase family protein n=1 Tax=Myceligenerans salitolerans TaxID=1230528 RepID=A0ABS3IAF8_9MICO|nr:endonuclease/exonuclease/phosphatase family protein [Myceligenerans salitolerans]MBO0609939.1 endonuclease/exonuclease/phosphatase family protein [Myceligenerans salitolerans]